MKDLRCLYCNGFLSIEMETVGRPYLTYDQPEYIVCETSSCGAEWEVNGDARSLPWQDRP